MIGKIYKKDSAATPMLVVCEMFCVISKVFSSSDVMNGSIVRDGAVAGSSSMAAHDSGTMDDDNWVLVGVNCIFCNEKSYKTGERSHVEIINESHRGIKNELGLVQCLECGDGFIHLPCLFKSYGSAAPDECACAEHFRRNIRGYVEDMIGELRFNRGTSMRECLSVLFLTMDADTIKDICEFKKRNTKELLALSTLGIKIHRRLIEKKKYEKSEKLHKLIFMIFDEVRDKMIKNLKY